MQTSYNRSQILRNAHSIKKANNITFADAQRQAWKEAKSEIVKDLLSSNVVTFQFEKENGEIRTAKGTLCTMLFFYENKGTQTIINQSTVKYWDLDANGFRCFKKSRFIKIIDIQAVQMLSMAA